MHAHSEPHRHSHELDIDTLRVAPLRALVLLTALSVHTLFEGLALGLMQKPESLAQLLLAVLLHKFLMAFTLGVRLVQTRPLLPARRALSAAAAFAFTMPLGVSLGVLLSATGDTGSEGGGAAQSVPLLLAEGALQGLAGGTFLFVAFCEMLPAEFLADDPSRGDSPAPRPHALLRVLALLVGYALLAAVRLLADA